MMRSFNKDNANTNKEKTAKEDGNQNIASCSKIPTENINPINDIKVTNNVRIVFTKNTSTEHMIWELLFFFIIPNI